MIRFVAMVTAALVMAGCAAAAEAPPPTTGQPASGLPDVRILAIGDSFTHGEGVATELAWPHVLAAALCVRGYDASVDIVAGTGWTARRAAAAMDRVDVDAAYDLVFIQVGVNDHFYEFGIDNYRIGLEQLVDDALAVAATPDDIALLSVVDWRVTPYGEELAALYRTDDVNSHNAALAAVASDHGLQYLDITTPSLGMRSGPSLVAADGLHASAALYARWVDNTLLPAALERLGG